MANREHIHKKDCEQIREDLTAYLSQTLSSRRCHVIDKHLQVCGDCSEIMQSFSWVWKELGQLSVPPAQDIKERVAKKVSSIVVPPVPSTRSTSIWTYGLAASFFLMLGMWFLYHNGGIPDDAAKIHVETAIPKQLSDIHEVRSTLKGVLKRDTDLYVPSETTLLGSNIRKLNGMVVAQVLYQYQGIPISLFAWNPDWPNAYDHIPKTLNHPVSFQRRRQSVVIWKNGNVLYCLVARLGAGELAAIFGLPTEIDHPT